MNEDAFFVDNLRMTVGSASGQAEVVHGVGLRLAAGQALGVVGESGSGKTLTLRAVLGLVPPGVQVVGGHVEVFGTDVLDMPQDRRRELLGGSLALVPQDALAALNPVLTVGRQLRETLRRHHGLRGRAAHEQALAALAEVGVNDPDRRLRQYPHQLSGGLRQRVVIAAALAGDPRLLICDEPTTALDVTVQAQILALLDRERRSRRMSVVLVSHDLGVVAGTTEQLVVMYGGRVVEAGPTTAVFADPRHPYTRALLACAPQVDGPRSRRLPVIPGAPPRIGQQPPGCAFAPRCRYVRASCRTMEPPLVEVGPGRSSACPVLASTVEVGA